MYIVLLKVGELIVDKATSSTAAVLLSVPQGVNFEPPLFLFFINDLQVCVLSNIRVSLLKNVFFIER